MPEVLEISLFKEWLNNRIKNRTITNIEKFSESKKFNFNIDCINTKVNKVNSKGKILWIELSKDINLLFHFGLFGFISYDKTKYSRIKISFDNKYDVYINDRRNFGYINALTTKELERKINNIGYDILKENNNITEYPKKQNICNFLINQKYVCGIGNMMKSEILYKCNINPLSTVENLDLNYILKECSIMINEFYNIAIKKFPDMPEKFNEEIFFNLYKEYGLSIYKRKFTLKNEKIFIIKTSDKRNTYTIFDIINK